MRKVLRSVAVAAVATVGMAVGFAQPASATDYGVNMDHACQITQNWPTSFAYLNTPYNAYSWRCGPVVSGVDVQAYCNAVYPGSTATVLNPSDPYSWRCRR
jgi:hypothetical protein